MLVNVVEPFGYVFVEHDIAPPETCGADDDLAL